MNIICIILLLYIVSFSTFFMGSSSDRSNYIKVKKQEINELKDFNIKLESYITLKNCNPSKFFNIEHYSCSVCPKKFFRTINNTICIHCPEDDKMCSKSPSNITNIHTLCLIGNNKLATIGSCVKCNYMSNHDKCYNNTCIECQIKTYSDNIGTCVYIISSNNSIFHNIITANNIFNISDSDIVSKILHTTTMIYNYRNKIFETTFLTIICYCFFSGIK